MKILILTANLGNFDKDLKDPVKQKLPEGYTVDFHRFTDEDFPPITGVSGRFQYRIPKLFGWEMKPGYDVYIWLDAAMSLQRDDSVQWLLDQLATADAAFFRHPWRGTVNAEVAHIENKLEEGNEYIVSRYKNGLHRENLELMQTDKYFNDINLYATTAFIYRNNDMARTLLRLWWNLQSRYYTCDQVSLPYAIFRSMAKVNKIPDNLFKIGYLSLVTHHK